MDHIIRALERAGGAQASEQSRVNKPSHGRDLPISDVDVSITHLESMRVVAHDAGDPRSKSFDLLRTQILQNMDTNGWRILAITSPTAGCGKTFTAINLALSIARQPESSVLLVDLDLKKPQVAQRLGLTCAVGLRSLLEGRASLAGAITSVSIGGFRLRLLPCERSSSHSSDWISSPRMTEIIQTMRMDHTAKVVILDLPPMLAGDEVVSILPQVDCVAMVAAVGTTKTVEIRECANFLRSTPLVRMILNKVPVLPAGYPY